MRRSIAVILLTALFLLIIWFSISPPRFWLNLTGSVELSNPELTGQTLVEKYNCRSCHLIDGLGEHNSPNLAGITYLLDGDTLRLQLQNPSAIKPDSAMPNFQLSDSEIEAIIGYLTAIDEDTGP